MDGGAVAIGRSLLSQAFLAMYLAVAPSTVEPWRLDISVRHSVTLTVGEPVRAIDPYASPTHV